MALRSSRSSRIARSLAALGLLAIACCWGGPAYAVKGSWEGAATALKGEDTDSILKGLEPTISLPPITFAREGLALSVQDGRLVADYNTKFGKDKTLELRVNDEEDWRAGLRTDDASLRVHGKGRSLENLFWEASQSGSVEGVGDVLLEFNSDKDYNLTVAKQQLGEILGAKLAAKVRATNDGVTGRLEARSQLAGNAALRYSVENPVGVYDLDKSTHVGELVVPVAAGEANLKVTYEDSAPRYDASYSRQVQGGQGRLRVSHKDGAAGYDVSYERDLGDVLPVPSKMHVGADDEGVYGKVTARRQLGHGADAEYEARARVTTGGEDASPELAHALKVSNKLGYAQLLHSSSESPRLRVGYEFNA
eukprot:TRINITY_DN2733_c0_g2_i2.p1 TRINITY_DN2733_c0_g2~~TRINITY_DN2733_c0_g2_i2.p1  ORF type:complete len:386 (+),score=79.87 TRINITY_DN2733_c0_g2_i2:65-1159(+)